MAWASASWVAPAVAEPADPIAGLLPRVDGFLHRGEVDGVTLETRHFQDFGETIRLTVVPQLAGYCELYRSDPRATTHQDIVDRANFLVRNGPAARTHDAADGLMAYALLLAFEAVGDPRYQAAAAPILAECLAFDEATASPNRGLMAALALAQHHRLSGDPRALEKAKAIVALTARSQHADGSFAHACDASHDLHYTAWIAMELDRIGELIEDPNVGRVLDQVARFLHERVGVDGAIRYEEIMPTGVTLYYYSRAYCSFDYDTRGWTNELAYHALIFDRGRDARYHGVTSRLAALESQGAFPDKWGFASLPSEPGYLWTTAPRSVTRTSVIFWAMASIQARRARRAPADYRETSPTGLAAAPEQGSSRSGSDPAIEAGEPGIGSIHPNPARDGAWIALRLERPAEARLDILDPGGRRVRALVLGSLPAGTTRIRWDGRGESGERLPAGVYFARLTAAGRVHAARIALID